MVRCYDDFCIKGNSMALAERHRFDGPHQRDWEETCVLCRSVLRRSAVWRGYRDFCGWSWLPAVLQGANCLAMFCFGFTSVACWAFLAWNAFFPLCRMDPRCRFGTPSVHMPRRAPSNQRPFQQMLTVRTWGQQCLEHCWWLMALESVRRAAWCQSCGRLLGFILQEISKIFCSGCLSVSLM